MPCTSMFCTNICNTTLHQYLQYCLALLSYYCPTTLPGINTFKTTLGQYIQPFTNSYNISLHQHLQHGLVPIIQNYLVPIASTLPCTNTLNMTIYQYLQHYLAPTYATLPCACTYSSILYQFLHCYLEPILTTLPRTNT